MYEIVKSDPNPHTYLCNQREIIVRQMLGWDVIQEHLNQLSEEGLLEMKQLGGAAVSITELGITKARSFIQAPKITFD